MATTILRNSAGILKTASGIIGIDWPTWPANVVVQASNVSAAGYAWGTHTVPQSTVPRYYGWFDTGGGVGPSGNLTLAVTSDGHLCWALSLTAANHTTAVYQSIKAMKGITPPNAIPYGSYTFLSESHNYYSPAFAGPYLVMRADDTGSIVTVTSANPLPRPMAGVAYSQTLTATGGTAPYTWTIDAGALPAGIALSSAGVLSGTPTFSGDFNITFRAFSADGYTAAKAFTSNRIMVVSGGVNFNQAAGWVPVSGTRTSSYRITNNGNTDLHVTGITHGTGFSGNWSGTIAPGAYHDVAISVTISAAPPNLAYYDVWPQGNWPAVDALTIACDASSSSGSAYFSVANYNNWSCD